ncbi:MAG TPA: SDR family oxidoreductase [Ferrovibrio sp.]|jgi:NAD(P)-dependent dehydrogenase (short-subunit alcohol dehydrogenase family)|uniref:SDR family oxidoreductase n=1 Tax=Ferrovibrio sp. TaxID=1917215 RepID=UPI002ED04558
MPTIVITGANRGIGLELVQQYAENGWSVIAACRDPARAEKLTKLRGGIRIEPLDVADPQGIAAFCEGLEGIGIDILFNNAGVYSQPDPLPERIDAGEFLRVLHTNTVAPLDLALALQRNLRRGTERKIVTMSTGMASIGGMSYGGFYAYRASKAGMNAAMRALALDLKEEQFTVAVLDPGWVRTDMGGPTAPLDVMTSARGLREVIARLGPGDSGKFFNYRGEEVPW